jgi:hypothetical protein
MNNERTVVLENISGQPVGLKDTQNRTYRFGVGGKIRISEMSLQDILDYPASKIIFNEGMIKISNIDANKLYEMGLTEKEITKFLGEDYSAVVIAEEIEEEPEEEEIIPIEEPKAVAPAAKTTTKKTTTTKKKTSSKKTK